VERARKAGASRIQDAIQRIRREHPALALHFKVDCTITVDGTPESATRAEEP